MRKEGGDREMGGEVGSEEEGRNRDNCLGKEAIQMQFHT